MQLKRLKKIGGAQREGGGQTTDVEQRDVALTSFDATEVATRQSTLKSQGLLRHAGLTTQLSQLPTKDDARVPLFDRELVRWHLDGIYVVDPFESTLYE